MVTRKKSSQRTKPGKPGYKRTRIVISHLCAGDYTQEDAEVMLTEYEKGKRFAGIYANCSLSDELITELMGVLADAGVFLRGEKAEGS